MLVLATIAILVSLPEAILALLDLIERLRNRQ